MLERRYSDNGSHKRVFHDWSSLPSHNDSKEQENTYVWRNHSTKIICQNTNLEKDFWTEEIDKIISPLRFSTIHTPIILPDFSLSQREGTQSKQFLEWLKLLNSDFYSNSISQNEIESIGEFGERIEELRNFAEEDNIQINQGSEENLWKFLNESEFEIKMDALYLNDNGNYRAVWDDGIENLIGVEFFETSKVHFVIMSRGKDNETINIAGEDSQSNVDKLIKLYELEEICAS